MSIGDVPVSRQQLLLGAGLGVVATTVACSPGAEKPAAPPSTEATSSTSVAPKAVAKTSDVPVGSGVIVDKYVLTQPTPGAFKAFLAVCTHAGCTLAGITDGLIDCPCHGSRFNLDGTVAKGPAQRPLTAQSITVQGDGLVVG